MYYLKKRTAINCDWFCSHFILECVVIYFKVSGKLPAYLLSSVSLFNLSFPHTITLRVSFPASFSQNLIYPPLRHFTIFHYFLPFFLYVFLSSYVFLIGRNAQYIHKHKSLVFYDILFLFGWALFY